MTTSLDTHFSNTEVNPANIPKLALRRLEHQRRRAVRCIRRRRQLDVEERDRAARGVVPRAVVSILGLEGAVIIPGRTLPVDEAGGEDRGIEVSVGEDGTHFVVLGLRS